MVETSGRVEKPDYPEQNAVTMYFFALSLLLLSPIIDRCHNGYLKGRGGEEQPTNADLINSGNANANANANAKRSINPGRSNREKKKDCPIRFDLI